MLLHEDEGKVNVSSRETTPPPPLPPRPQSKEIFGDHLSPSSGSGTLRLASKSSRPSLLSQATTAVSRTDVHTRAPLDTESTKSSPPSHAASIRPGGNYLSQLFPQLGEVDDTASVKSFKPGLEPALDGESLFGEVNGSDNNDNKLTNAWQKLNSQLEHDDSLELVLLDDDMNSLQLQDELEGLEPTIEDSDEQTVLHAWSLKLKHFFILSSSGKPIYSRHGDDQLVSRYIGIIQTIISFYEESNDVLRTFTAGKTRFVILCKGPLYLVATSRLRESEAQLRNQLESLYMQILSTLTLPHMERIFANRPSSDLRRPLQGTEVLLDGLADGFTRGSPSTLLSSLECLRMRRSERKLIDEALLKTRSPSLLYGLLVASGRLVSVVRPKRHSLHPGDLHLIFNMLFEAGSVKANGGENWIPLCLPGFNNTGYVYMYVSFFSTNENSFEDNRASSANDNDELAIVFISASKEAFYELRTMRDELVGKLQETSLMSTIKKEVRKGHAACSELIPGTVLRHFLYKSKGNVQFVMPSFGPHFGTMVTKRRLMSLYHEMHESMHVRTANLKVQHSAGRTATMIAWETPMFELYCVAGPHASRTALSQGANRIVQWIKREEERIFIIGGAVF
ncbi:DUF254-domain-containing protein [Polychaeton citri CBS 116435]|uniref:Vacuolar fusion protein MON1 n=1 Tax=Polychaeton citri CBS 116435 TaxID=1314669 RepID=A0A9P4US85_9PEZI|nr:DUF254-domain-containing protein [Polychaeton citri CBS 116435]